MGTNEEKIKIYKARWLILPTILVWFLCMITPIMEGLSNLFGGIVFGLVGMGAVGVLLQKESKTGQKFKFEWKWQDWGGLIIFVAVIYAVAMRVDPITLMKIIAAIFKNN